MEIYNRYLDLETLKLIFKCKSENEKIIIYTDETKEYGTTLRFFNIKGIIVKYKDMEYKKEKKLVMDLIKKGVFKETILKYGKGELSKNKFDDYNLELLKKLDLDDYIEMMTPYLIKKGYFIEERGIFELFRKYAKNAGSLVWYINTFFFDSYYNSENEFNYDLDKNNKDFFIKEVEYYLKNDEKFYIMFLLKITNNIFFDFDIINYVKLSDFPYLIFKLYGIN